MYLYDGDRNFICKHPINECRGSINQLPEHRKLGSTDWISIMESMRRKWNCASFQHFINGFKKENPRHLSQQLSAVERYLDAQKAERELVAQVMEVCCRDLRYRYSQFKTVFELINAGRSDGRIIDFNEVQQQNMDVYKRAFQDRCELERDWI